MLPRNSYLKYIGLVFISLFIISIYAFYFNYIFLSITHPALDSTPTITTPSSPIFLSSNLSNSGSGNPFNCYENAWGTKNHNSLNENSIISWDIPSSWTGTHLDVSISNLREVLSRSLDLQSTSSIERSGTNFGGSHINTHTIGAGSYNWSWGFLTPLNFTLKFQTTVVISSITQLRIATYSYWNDNQSQLQPVDFFIHNFNLNTNELLGQTPENPPFNWANATKNSGFSNYISSSGEIWIIFHANTTEPLQPNSYYLDFVTVEIDATYRWITPQDVSLTLTDGVSNYPITGTNASGNIAISGSWTADPQNFQFSTSGEQVIFDAISSFYLSKNQIGNVTTTYYLNTTHPTPLQHLWKLNLYQDPLPSANYTNLNFSLSFMPLDWTFINATDPSGSLQNLDILLLPDGQQLDADTGDITPTGGLWNIFFNSPNYINAIELQKDLTPLPYNPFLIIWDTLDVRSTFLNPIINGNINLTVSFEGKVNHSQIYTGISGNSINFASWQINSTSNKNGIYYITVSFFNHTELGIYTTPITVGFPTNLTMLSPRPQYLEFLKGDILNITIFLENRYYPGNYYNEWGIPNAQVRWEFSNSTGYITSGNLSEKDTGIYNISLDTGTLDLWDGPYNLTITANKTYYENQTHTIQLLCFQTIHPTTGYLTNIQRVTGNNYTVDIFPNQSLNIQMNYTDIFSTPRLIDYANISAFLYTSGGQFLPNYTKTGTRIAPGLYELDFSNLNLHIGVYTLLINYSKKFYSNSSIWINYTINPLIPVIEVSKFGGITNITSYDEWENLTISIQVEYNTTMYYGYSSWDAPIDWALVQYFIVPYNGDPLNPSDLLKSGVLNFNANGVFELRNLPLSNASGNFAPGTYEIYIKSNATDCLERWYHFNLTIHQKLAVILTIEQYPSQFDVNQLLSIRAQLYSDQLGSTIPFNGKVVHFNFTVYYTSAAPISFSLSDAADTNGEAEKFFFLRDYVSSLDGIERIEFNAYFEGYEAFYPTYSFYGTSTSFYSITIVAPLDYSFVIFIVLGIVVGILSLIVIQKKVLAPKQEQKVKSINYLFTSFRDVVGIQNLFVLHKTTGECILQKTYSPGGIDSSMETILINVIANYGKGDQRHDAFCDIVRFESFMLLLDDGEFIRVAITVGTLPSDKLIRSLVRFVQFFELQNYSLLKTSKVEPDELKGVDDLLDIQFGSSLIAPYTISKISKLSGFEETLALMATSLMTDHDYFYISQLYTRAKEETLIDEMMIFGTIQRLLDKKVIVPYVSTEKSKAVQERIAKTEFDRLKVNLISLKNKALKAINEGQYQDAVDYYHEAANLAVTMGDLNAKTQFLHKAREYSLRIQSAIKEEPSKESPRKLADQLLSEEQVEPPQAIEAPPSTPPSSLDEIRLKSKEISKTVQPLSTTTSDQLLGEEVAPPTDLTPFEQLTKAADLLTEKTLSSSKDMIAPPIERPPEASAKEPDLSEDALSLLEEAVKLPEPTSATSSLIDEVIKEAELYAEEPISIVDNELKLQPTPSEEAQIEEILAEIETSTKVTKKPEETILNALQTSLNEAKTLLQPLPDTLWTLNSTIADLNKLKNKTQRQIKETKISVLNALKSLNQRLQAPLNTIETEIATVDKEIPQIITQIDQVDQSAVNIKKEISSAQKETKKIKEELGKIFNKLSTIDKSLAGVTANEFMNERQEFQNLKDTFNDAMKNLEDIEKELHDLNQLIVNLMIEDIEQMMEEEQKTEKIFNIVTKKLKDTLRLQKALDKENLKITGLVENLTNILSFAESAFSEYSSQKEGFLSHYTQIESDYNYLLKELEKNKRRDALSLTTKIQTTQSLLANQQQVLESLIAKLQGILKKLSNIDKIKNSIEKRKDRITRALEKAAKFVFPECIKDQETKITEFTTQSYSIIQKGYELQKTLQEELNLLSHTLYQKLKNMSKQLQKITKNATKQARKFKEEQDNLFFQNIANNLNNTPESVEDLQVETISTTSKPPLTDQELGIKQHCPYCGIIISEKILNLLKKGFEPECSNCGEVIKPSDVQLD
ncbi:MAG: hypothetical protein ACTSRS_12485 [Candidatus Helarchaeota archaeon]